MMDLSARVARSLLFLLVSLSALRITVESFQPFGRRPSSVHRARRIYFTRISAAAAEPSVVSSPSSSDSTTVVVNGDSVEKDNEVISLANGVESSDTTSDSVPIFDAIAHQAGLCLLQSDISRDAIGQEQQAEFVAKGATNWIDDASSLRLKQVVNRLQLNNRQQQQQQQQHDSGMDRDDALAWMRWMKSIPCPAILDLTSEFQQAVNQTSLVNNPKGTRMLELLEQGEDEFLQRFACRVILLPSGAALSSPLVETSSSLIHGKLLYGGVTRSRLLQRQGQQEQYRLVGERQAIQTSSMQNVEAWTLFGGPPRMYQAVDMGPAALLEVLILPRGTSVTTDISTSSSDLGNQNMILTGGPSTMWTPQKMFCIHQQSDDDADNASSVDTTTAPTSSTTSMLSGRQRNDAFRSDFQSTVGGLQSQIDSIVRRVLDGRVIRPADNENGVNGQKIKDNDDDLDSQEMNLSMASLEAQELELLGLTPVRGLLLYGPPGCGKTVLAREISKALRARTPKIVSAPELLDRWVGGSEKLVRALFAEAEAELAVCQGDARKSALHVIVIDEIDAVFRKRTDAQDSGEATRSSVVNQILAKLDGVNSIPNVLLVGMTNRRELLDEALLRPGRLEVQIEIPLPDKNGRREILQIHFDALRQRGRLSKPLCAAIDGVSSLNEYSSDGLEKDDNNDAEVDVELLVSSKRKRIKRAIRHLASRARLSTGASYDLAAETSGFSGADIAGLVRCAGSIALARARKEGSGVEGLLITLEDVKQALTEVNR